MTIVRPLLLALALAAHPLLPAADSPTVEQVAASVSALEARLERIERALGLPPAPAPAPAAEELQQTVQVLRDEVSALRHKLEAAPAVPPPAVPAPAAPTVTSKLAATLYGYIKLDAIYDTQKTSIGDAAFFVLPKVDGRSDDEFNMTARESRLGLRVQAPRVGDLAASAVLEMDFYGGGAANSTLPRMRLAYADLAGRDWSLRAGQDWEPFITVIPKCLDFSYLADQGALGLRRGQLRLTRKFGEPASGLWETRLAAVRTIGQDLDGGGQDDGVDAGLPTLQWNVIREQPSGLKLSLSGHLGREDVELIPSGRHEGYETWSVIASWIVPLSPKVSLQGTAWTGSNLDTYYGGVGQGVNRTLGCSIDASGAFVQLVLNPDSKLNINFTAGLDDPDDDCLSPGMRSANRHLSGSVFYQWTPAVRTGLEITDMNTGYVGLPDARDLRIHSGIYLMF